MFESTFPGAGELEGGGAVSGQGVEAQLAGDFHVCGQPCSAILLLRAKYSARWRKDSNICQGSNLIN